MDKSKIGKINLPIDRHISEIQELLTENSNLILMAPPGSGKTTRVPASLMDKFKKIIVLVPKRIAAVSAAIRICEENNILLGDLVGYQVRFENKTTPSTKLIFMTEGLFVKRINDTKLWSNLDLIVFDEFHERSSLSDITFGICHEKQILEEKLKIIVMSATLNTSHLVDYLDNVRTLKVEVEPYSLEVIQSRNTQKLSCGDAFAVDLLETIKLALTKSHRDILVFLPGLSEIKFIERFLLKKIVHAKIAILHGSISLTEQREVLNSSGTRKIILATNIAESSLTLPDVDCVIDSGLEKKPKLEKKIGFSRLEIGRISKFSARQRAGRAARTSPGVCFQMWHELDERSMSTEIEPEILNSTLLDEALILFSMGYKDLNQFSWFEKPKASLTDVFKKLNSWDVIDSNGNITEKGFCIQSLPLAIERGLLFFELATRGHLESAAKFIAHLESARFSGPVEHFKIDELLLDDNGMRIFHQLMDSIEIKRIERRFQQPFLEALVDIFIKYFPNKVAKQRDKNFAVSTLGRGVELNLSPSAGRFDFYLLFSGFESSSALTKIDFAIGFMQNIFEKYCQSNTAVESTLHCDFELRKLYKLEIKRIGGFETGNATKSFLGKPDEKVVFQEIFTKNCDEFLNGHNDYKTYLKKLSFLKEKSHMLGLSKIDFEFESSLSLKLVEVISPLLNYVSDFFELNLYQYLLFLTPENIKSNLTDLPSHFLLPNGKQISINYSCEQAPLLSARIQDFFGLKTTPKILNGKLPVTLELLAPNYRPTQITGNLELFWSSSYFEVRKELRGRYPKHSWPDNPQDHIIEKRNK